MRRAIVMPEVGDPAPTLSLWFVQVGETVDCGDRLVEILAAGATLEVPAPTPGRLAEILVRPEEPVHPGQILGYIDEDLKSAI